jgi:GTP cyclohydrolase I
MSEKLRKKSGRRKSEEIPKLAVSTRFPSPISKNLQKLSPEEKIAIIEDKFRDIMLVLGLDLEDESLAETPHRVARMYVNEIFEGLDPSNFPEITIVKDGYNHKEHGNIVFVKVSFTSFCEHHFVPMNGVAYVAYIPNGNLIGLSKIPRIVRYFSRRPQLQERLTAQIADSLSTLLNTEDVAVSVSATHYCVVARGIENEHSHTTTNAMRGKFDTTASFRQEFFEAINREH